MRVVIVGLLFFGLTAQAQPGIKKIKVTELQEYIAKSDHPLIVNFWATYCDPCVKEIPYFESTVARFNAEKVELILVSLDLPSYYPDRITGFTKKNGFNSSVWWLNESDADYFCPRVDTSWTGGIPCSLFINNKSHYRRFFDRQLTEPQVGPAIKAMIAQP
jgi:thiol-disulfide isomerase/thioredoxin